MARNDVAACAAVVLLDAAEVLAAGRATAHDGRTSALIGPEAYASRAAYGAPPWQLDAWVSTYTAIASGDLAPVTGDVAALLGRSARSLSEALRLPPGRTPRG